MYEPLYLLIGLLFPVYSLILFYQEAAKDLGIFGAKSGVNDA
jgi:hypothetical protein